MASKRRSVGAGRSAPVGPRSEPGDTVALDDLVARCLDHDESAWHELVRRYSRLIYSTIHRVGLPVDERDEAFQASIVAIYEHLGDLRDPAALVPWMIGITWRQAVDCIRRRGRASRVRERHADAEAERSEAPTPMTPPDEELLRLERAQQAQEALQALPERCRRLLRYLFYEHPSPEYGEIARRERMPIGSLGPTRARCIERLRSYFRDRGWLG